MDDHVQAELQLGGAGAIGLLLGLTRALHGFATTSIADVAGGLMFAISSAYAALAGGAPYPTVGASGGIFGLLLAFAMYFPRQTIVLLIPPIPMPAWLFVTLYGALELFLGVTGEQAGVAHFAHLGGMVGAWLLIRYWRGRPPFRRR